MSYDIKVGDLVVFCLSQIKRKPSYTSYYHDVDEPFHNTVKTERVWYARKAKAVHNNTVTVSVKGRAMTVPFTSCSRYRDEK